MYAEYAEPTSAAEMRARYARIREKTYRAAPSKRTMEKKPKIRLLFLHEYNHHVIIYLKWKLAKEAGASQDEIEKIIINSTPPKKHVSDIIKEVSRETGVSAEEILGTRGQVHIAEARQLAMAKVYAERRDLSLTQIGRKFDRHHTTVLHAARKYGVCPE